MVTPEELMERSFGSSKRTKDFSKMMVTYFMEEGLSIPIDLRNNSDWIDGVKFKVMLLSQKYGKEIKVKTISKQKSFFIIFSVFFLFIQKFE